MINKDKSKNEIQQIAFPVFMMTNNKDSQNYNRKLLQYYFGGKSSNITEIT